MLVYSCLSADQVGEWVFPIIMEGTDSAFFQVDACRLIVQESELGDSDLRGYSFIRCIISGKLQCHAAHGRCPCSFFWWDEFEASLMPLLR